MVNAFKIKMGSVRAFEQRYSNDVENINLNPKCRSFRIRNVGGVDFTLKIGGLTETIAAGSDSITYGGYPFEYRADQLSGEFTGGGANPEIIIIQDVQQTDPIFYAVSENIKPEKEC